MIYFDNAATTYPKPRAVRETVSRALTQLGANPGRGGHEMAYAAAKKFTACEPRFRIFLTSARPETSFLQKNCTEAPQPCYQGTCASRLPFCLLRFRAQRRNAPAGNAETARRLHLGSRVHGETEEKTVAGFQACIRKNTVAIICTGASNVFGKLCRSKNWRRSPHAHGIPFVADLAQTGRHPAAFHAQKRHRLCLRAGP